jgi:ABC-type multidrug transport system fused ATPase/permease subunit
MLPLPLIHRGRRRRLARAMAHDAPHGTGPVQQPDNEPDYRPLSWEVISKALVWMRPYRKDYAIGAVAGLLATVLDMLGPAYIRHLVDHDLPVSASFQRHFAAGWVSSLLHALSATWQGDFERSYAAHMAAWNITLTIALWACTNAVSIAISRFLIFHMANTGQRVLLALRRAVFEKLQQLSMSFYDKTKFGRILTRGTSDLDAMNNPVVNGVNIIINNAAQMTIAIVLMLFFDWRVALCVLWLGPILYYMNKDFRRRAGMRQRDVREGYTRVSTNLAENINGMKVVAAFNRQGENLSAFNDLQNVNTSNNVRASVTAGLFQAVLQVVGFAGKTIILIVGCTLVFATADGPVEQKFTVGTLIALYIYWDWFMGPILNFGNFQNELMLAMASAERVFALLEQVPEVGDAAGAKPLQRIAGGVRFEGVSFAYDPKKPVLHEVTFDAPAGSTIALVGHTGCGKSTIMNLICRFYLPTAGRVCIDGQDVNTIQGDSLHQQMGIVSQANYLFSGTVLDNIRYARPSATLAEVQAAAEQLGSHEMINQLKDGYDTQVGERGAAMSLGQRQLICFTRAFLADPRILMLDEATSAVDTHTEQVIQKALETLVADRTTFIVAHRLSTVVGADMVLVLDHGRIIERGTHGELLKLGGVYAGLYQQFTREI